jgi:hypothetical protein
MRARAWLVIVVALSLVGIAACSPRRSGATIEVDKPVALADTPVHVRVSRLGSGDEVTISAQAHDAGGKVWRSQAQFTADGGVSTSTVPSRRQAPTRAWTAWACSGR